MKNKSLILGCAGGAITLLTIAIFITWGIGVYNNLISLNENVSDNWKSVEEQFTNRADILPNLLMVLERDSTAKQLTIAEFNQVKSEIKKITHKNDLLNEPALFDKYKSLQSQLDNIVSETCLEIENYPELKGSEKFQLVQAQLTRIEASLKSSKTEYNKSAEKFNLSLKSFPENLFGRIFGFKLKNFLD